MPGSEKRLPFARVILSLHQALRPGTGMLPTERFFACAVSLMHLAAQSAAFLVFELC
jgi:hypothetical protein